MLEPPRSLAWVYLAPLFLLMEMVLLPRLSPAGRRFLCGGAYSLGGGGYLLQLWLAGLHPALPEFVGALLVALTGLVILLSGLLPGLRGSPLEYLAWSVIAAVLLTSVLLKPAPLWAQAAAFAAGTGGAFVLQWVRRKPYCAFWDKTDANR